MSPLTTASAEEIKDVDAAYGLQNYGRFDLVLERGNGAYVFDTDDKCYLDCVSGLAVNALGHNDHDLVEAIRAQAAKLIHVSNLYYTAPAAQLSRTLVANSCADRAFFCNSGTEAVEGALKFARKYAAVNRPSEARGIVAFENSFHGRSMGALSVTGQERYRRDFGPLIPDVDFVDFNNIDWAMHAIHDGICAVIVEPLQGEGGVNIANVDFLVALRARCDEIGALLIFDEVQCGLGRIGTLFAYEHFGVEPDIITLAKALAGGLPMGAILCKQRVAQAISPGDHAATFGGNPLVAAAANVVVDKLIDLDLPQQAKECGEKFEARLKALQQKHATIKDVKGLGLIWGVETEIDASELVAEFQARQILTCQAGPEVLRFLPPLIITEDSLMGVADVLDEILTNREQV